MKFISKKYGNPKDKYNYDEVHKMSYTHMWILKAEIILLYVNICILGVEWFGDLNKYDSTLV